MHRAYKNRQLSLLGLQLELADPALEHMPRVEGGGRGHKTVSDYRRVQFSEALVPSVQHGRCLFNERSVWILLFGFCDGVGKSCWLTFDSLLVVMVRRWMFRSLASTEVISKIN